MGSQEIGAAAAAGTAAEYDHDSGSGKAERKTVCSFHHRLPVSVQVKEQRFLDMKYEDSSQ